MSAATSWRKILKRKRLARLINPPWLILYTPVPILPSFLKIFRWEMRRRCPGGSGGGDPPGPGWPDGARFWAGPRVKEKSEAFPLPCAGRPDRPLGCPPPPGQPSDGVTITARRWLLRIPIRESAQPSIPGEWPIRRPASTTRPSSLLRSTRVHFS